MLDSPAFKAAIDAMKGDTLAALKKCPIRDKEGAFLLTQLMKMADMFEGYLVGAIESGKFAQHKIDIDSLRDESAARKFMRRVA